MYLELSVFARHLWKDKSFRKDGELWTAVISAGIAAYLFYQDPSRAVRLRAHFESLLTITSIIFGFALTALLFYVQAASQWSRDERTREGVGRLIDWHVYTVLSLLVLIGYVLLLWIAGTSIVTPVSVAIAYGLLSALFVYCCAQIVNHTLTVWWVFKKQSVLMPDDTVRPFDSQRKRG